MEAVVSSPAKTLMLTYRSDDKRALQFVKAMKMMDFFDITESPYNQNYVAEVKAIKKSSCKAVSRENLWR